MIPKTNFLELSHKTIYVPSIKFHIFAIAVIESLQATRFYRETGLNFSAMGKTNLNLFAMYKVQIFCNKINKIENPFNSMSWQSVLPLDLWFKEAILIEQLL